MFLKIKNALRMNEIFFELYPEETSSCIQLNYHLLKQMKKPGRTWQDDMYSNKYERVLEICASVFENDNPNVETAILSIRTVTFNCINCLQYRFLISVSVST